MLGASLQAEGRVHRVPLAHGELLELLPRDRAPRVHLDRALEVDARAARVAPFGGQHLADRDVDAGLLLGVVGQIREAGPVGGPRGDVPLLLAQPGELLDGGHVRRIELVEATPGGEGQIDAVLLGLPHLGQASQRLDGLARLTRRSGSPLQRRGELLPVPRGVPASLEAVEGADVLGIELQRELVLGDGIPRLRMNRCSSSSPRRTSAPTRSSSFGAASTC